MMTPARPSFASSYVRFAATAVATAALLAALGYVPTVRLIGDGAVAAIIGGCGISLAASCLGAIPLAAAASGPAAKSAQGILMSTGVRFLVVLVLVVPAVLSGWFHRNALVTWVAFSYMTMLLVDTTFAVRLMKRFEENPTK